MGNRRPSFQWYAADWLKAPEVRAVSLEARGLWIDMLCLMDQSPRRGYLQHATGKPVTPEQLARMTGCSAEQVSRLLQELKDAGVFSSSEHGVIYSRRMVRDERIRQIRSEAGSKGGSPLLKQKVNQNPTTRLKQNPTPSSSSSSSPSGLDPPSEDLLPPKSPKQKTDVPIPSELDTPEFRDAWAEWLAFRKERRLSITERMTKGQFKFLAGIAVTHGLGAVLDCIEKSIRNGWQGLFPPDGKSNGKPNHNDRSRFDTEGAGDF